MDSLGPPSTFKISCGFIGIRYHKIIMKYLVLSPHLDHLFSVLLEKSGQNMIICQRVNFLKTYTKWQKAKSTCEQGFGDIFVWYGYILYKKRNGLEKEKNKKQKQNHLPFAGVGVSHQPWCIHISFISFFTNTIDKLKTLWTLFAQFVLLRREKMQKLPRVCLTIGLVPQCSAQYQYACGSQGNHNISHPMSGKPFFEKHSVKPELFQLEKHPFDPLNLFL